jgi:hypothetical protein
MCLYFRLFFYLFFKLNLATIWGERCWLACWLAGFVAVGCGGGGGGGTLAAFGVRSSSRPREDRRPGVGKSARLPAAAAWQACQDTEFGGGRQTLSLPRFPFSSVVFLVVLPLGFGLGVVDVAQQGAGPPWSKFSNATRQNECRESLYYLNG